MLRNERQEQAWSSERGPCGENESCMSVESECGRAEKSIWAAVADELAFGMLLVDRQRRLVQANRAAMCELRIARCLRLMGDLIEPVEISEMARFQRVLDGAQRGRRGYLMLGGTADGTAVAFLPVQDAGLSDGVCAALVFERRVDAAGLGLYFYSQACQLTQGEGRVLAGLSEGLDVAQVAAGIGCAVNTVRTHVRNLLAKTGQTTLRALVGRLGRLPPVACRIVPGANERRMPV